MFSEQPQYTGTWPSTAPGAPTTLFRDQPTTTTEKRSHRELYWIKFYPLENFDSSHRLIPEWISISDYNQPSTRQSWNKIKKLFPEWFGDKRSWWGRYSSSYSAIPLLRVILPDIRNSGKRLSDSGVDWERKVEIFSWMLYLRPFASRGDWEMIKERCQDKYLLSSLVLVRPDINRDNHHQKEKSNQLGPDYSNKTFPTDEYNCITVTIYVKLSCFYLGIILDVGLCPWMDSLFKNIYLNWFPVLCNKYSLIIPSWDLHTMLSLYSTDIVFSIS